MVALYKFQQVKRHVFNYAEKQKNTARLKKKWVAKRNHPKEINAAQRKESRKLAASRRLGSPPPPAAQSGIIGRGFRLRERDTGRTCGGGAGGGLDRPQMRHCAFLAERQPLPGTTPPIGIAS